jgi:hypothetical protein
MAAANGVEEESYRVWAIQVERFSRYKGHIIQSKTLDSLATHWERHRKNPSEFEGREIKIAYWNMTNSLFDENNSKYKPVSAQF